MGIQGLTTYIAQHSDVYLQNYSLHDTYLVIDGNSLASQLYRHEAKTNGCFGGDYDKYAFCVSNFFEELLKCNITPLIIIDGGSEDKKMSTLFKRTRDKIRVASHYTPSQQTRAQLFPLLLKEVFKSVASEKGIRCAQSLFEADDDISSVARILNCPVLSYDSDFYIFDVTYIPYNTLDYGIHRIQGGYAKSCKAYRIDNFIERFPGMDKKVMPLAATLLGNDYIQRSVFRDFFSTLKLSKTSKRRFNEMQRRIEATFRWLQKQTLDSAIARVLSKLPAQKRKDVLEIIEMIVNGYLIANPRMMYPLGFSPDDINRAMLNIPRNPYKFQQDINNLKVVEEPKNDDESDLSGDDYDAPREEEVKIVKPASENNLCKIAPSWFLQEFKTAKYPSYFIDMLCRQLYICPVHVEDFSQPTCINISLKIIRVIFKLLNAGTSNSNSLEYIARGSLTNVSRQRLQCDDIILSCKYPPLSQLRDLPSIITKKILNDTLGVSDEILNNFPPEWQLYIATIKYWVDNAEPSFRTNCHLYALLFGMIYHVIDMKVGYIRSQAFFDTRYGQEFNQLQQSRNNFALPVPVLDISIYDAYINVNREDCLLAVPFFLANFIMDQRLLMNRKKFLVSSVHSFSLFQNCLRHAMHLNALLGYPYPMINVAKFFNGTLLYNLYNSFKSRNDIDNYICTILRDSPTLLQLFKSVITMVRSMFNEAFDNKVNSGKRRKHKHRRNNDPQTARDVSEDRASCHDEVPYYDVNNRYTALNMQHF